MATVEFRPTAKIYQFPVNRIRERRERELAAEFPVVDCSSASWYHEEAIREAEDTRKQ